MHESRPAVDLATVEAASFEPFLQESFSTRPVTDVPGEDLPPPSQSPEIAACLEKVEPQPRLRHPAQRRVPFSLFFRLPPGVRAEQGIYVFSHEKLGSLECFVVPVGVNDRGLLLQAVFN